MALKFAEGSEAKIATEVVTDSEGLLNDIKILVDRNFTLKGCPDGIETSIHGSIKLDLINQSLVFTFEPS